MLWGLIVFNLVLWLAVLIAEAPEGWQDETGFHIGRER